MADDMLFDDSDEGEFMFDDSDGGSDNNNDDDDDGDGDDGGSDGGAPGMEVDPETEMMNLYYQSKGDVGSDDPENNARCVEGFRRVVTLGIQLNNELYVRTRYRAASRRCTGLDQWHRDTFLTKWMGMRVLVCVCMCAMHVVQCVQGYEAAGQAAVPTGSVRRHDRCLQGALCLRQGACPIQSNHQSNSIACFDNMTDTTRG